MNLVLNDIINILDGAKLERVAAAVRHGSQERHLTVVDWVASPSRQLAVFRG